jgi:hypothetical protein
MMINRKRGRPPETPASMKDGFYIEVRNKRSTDRGIKLHSETREAMEKNADHYSRSKDVIILGECRNNKWVTKAGKKG